eukprot:1088698-Pleurochrysis_carterae.AAC.2
MASSVWLAARAAHLDVGLDVLVLAGLERMRLRPLAELEVADGGELEAQVLHRLARVVDHEHVEHDVVRVDEDVGLGVDRVGEAGELGHALQSRGEVELLRVGAGGDQGRSPRACARAAAAPRSGRPPVAQPRAPCRQQACQPPPPRGAQRAWLRRRAGSGRGRAAARRGPAARGAAGRPRCAPASRRRWTAQTSPPCPAAATP